MFFSRFEIQNARHQVVRAIAIAATVFSTSALGSITPTDDAKTVASLDIDYQAAVAKGDVNTMSRILADDFILTTGAGKAFSKSDLLSEARSGKIVYEHQEASSRTVRIWGDTAVVTALLWAKGTESGKAFEYRLWFSDTYVRSTSGWHYVFGQASLPLPISH